MRELRNKGKGGEECATKGEQVEKSEICGLRREIAMPPRDELLLIVELTPTLLRAGVGVFDVIRLPAIEISTRLGRKRTNLPPTVLDYLAGPILAQAEQAGEEVDIILPLQTGKHGLQVNDWIGLEALLYVISTPRTTLSSPRNHSSRYILHISLYLPRPPLAHPLLLSLPSQLPKDLIDQFHAFFFEKLLVPQLLIATRPFCATIGVGALNSIVLDIGARGDGSDISVIVDCQPLTAAHERFPIDEGTLDDYLALLLLLDNPSLPHTLYPTAPLTPAELVVALRIIIDSLKNAGHISFLSPLLPPAPIRLVPDNDKEGEFDVAKVLVEGKVDKLIGKAKEKKGKGKKEVTELAGDYVQVGHPYDLEAAPIQIGPIRHRYLEPLFLPSLLAQLAPSHSPAAASLGFTEYEGRPVLHSGVQEVMGLVAESIKDFDQRKLIWDNVIVTSVGKVAGNKGSPTPRSILYDD